MAETRRGSKSRTFPVQATSVASELAPENPKRVGLCAYNNGSITAYVLSAKTLKTTDGIPLKPGATYENTISTAPYWIIADSGTQDIRCEEVSE